MNDDALIDAIATLADIPPEEAGLFLQGQGQAVLTRYLQAHPPHEAGYLAMLIAAKRCWVPQEGT